MKRFLPLLAMFASSAIGATFLVPSDEMLVRASRAIVVATAGGSDCRYAPGGFVRLAHRRMTALDMQAWTACRMIGEAASRTASADPANSSKRDRLSIK